MASNHINYFDSAVIRSHRFDALVLVSPPSFVVKTERLATLLLEVHDIQQIKFQVKEEQVQEELEKIEAAQEAHRSKGGSGRVVETEEDRIARWREQKLDSERLLAKFALLRYDELDELAYRLALILKAKAPPKTTISRAVLEKALGEVADSEWRKNKSYVDYLRDTRSERRDHQMMNVWEVRHSKDLSVPGVRDIGRRRWLPLGVDSLADISIPGFSLLPMPRGRVRIQALAAT